MLATHHLLVSEQAVKAGVGGSICTFLKEIRRKRESASQANQKTKPAPDADFGGLGKVSFSFFLIVSL
jgi:hypothetical protein